MTPEGDDTHVITWLQKLQMRCIDTTMRLVNAPGHVRGHVGARPINTNTWLLPIESNMRCCYFTVRAIGMHAIKGSEASHALYGNRSACRCGVGDYDGALADAEECIRLSPSWGKGYVRKGAALYGLYRFDDAVKTYEIGLTHEPSLAPLTDGLNDALRRRKAMGGRWTISDAPPDADPLLAPFSLMRLSIGNGAG